MDGSKAEPSISFLLEFLIYNFHGRFSLFSNIFAARLAVYINNLYLLYTARSAERGVVKIM